MGLCPFHTDKSPSFYVSPAKNICKCFSCNEGGDSVNFLMKHESYSYPEALKVLADKYHIEVEEEERTPEQVKALNERESLYLISKFAEQHFMDNLHKTDTGKAIGLSYFKERGITDAAIEKFALGYAIDEWSYFTNAAKEKGYKEELLVKTGLTINSNNKTFDRFKGRVMFPIHSLSGRVIGFGGRTLITDKKVAKYVNSPESEIYEKRKVLYGLFQAKKALIKEDNCYLVEGYTDVIAMHMSGIENVVASSGTALTVEQIQLIKRYTKNITMLFDGDAAGLKASFRGIDMILEAGMNVKVVMFPDGEDPDSFSKKVSDSELVEYLVQNAKDFILFKSDVLLAETENDPIKKSQVVHEMVASIALIPDDISRSVYVKECSRMMNVQEQALLNELNKIRLKKLKGKYKEQAPQFAPEEEMKAEFDQIETQEASFGKVDCSGQEFEIIRLLMNYGTLAIELEQDEEAINVAEFIVDAVLEDDLQFENELYELIFDEYSTALDAAKALNEDYFVAHENAAVRKVALSLVVSHHNLSENWEKKHLIIVEDEEMQLKRAVEGTVYAFKLRKIQKMIEKIQNDLKTTVDNDDLTILMNTQLSLMEAKKQISKKLGREILF